jgi:sensor domain CHASE-containing protein|tara:strand:- start:1261 stop:1767 length:507 start_codon:yes stop_codon:yes gene_type:complete
VTFSLIEFVESRLPEIMVAVVTAIAGVMWTQIWAKRRVRHSVAGEILSIQTAIYRRAAPDIWRTDALREQWMLEPYLRHVDILREMAGSEGLARNVIDELRGYHVATEVFIVAWSSVRSRHQANFWDPYEKMLEAAEAVLKSVGRRGALSKKFSKLQRDRRITDEGMG